MFRWVPWLFDLQYRLFMDFAPTRWLATRLLTMLRPARADAADPGAQPRPDRLHLPRRDRSARRAAAQRAPEGARATPRSPTSPGCASGHIPGSTCTSSPTPSRIEEVERIAGPGSVRWAKPPTSPAFLAPRVARATPARALGLPAEGPVIAVSGGGWGVGDLIGATSGRAAGRRTRSCCACADATTSCATASTRALRGRSAAARDGLHRPDGRRAGRRQRADPLERRADRARGDHPRLPGDLLRLRLRARARLQPCARALRARAGRPRASPTLGPALERALAHSARSPTARSRAARRPRR